MATVTDKEDMPDPSWQDRMEQQLQYLTAITEQMHTALLPQGLAATAGASTRFKTSMRTGVAQDSALDESGFSTRFKTSIRTGVAQDSIASVVSPATPNSPSQSFTPIIVSGPSRRSSLGLDFVCSKDSDFLGKGGAGGVSRSSGGVPRSSSGMAGSLSELFDQDDKVIRPSRSAMGRSIASAMKASIMIEDGVEEDPLEDDEVEMIVESTARPHKARFAGFHSMDNAGGPVWTFMIAPYSKIRVGYDFFGCAICLMDMFVTSVAAAWEWRGDGLYFLFICVLVIYWSLDIVVSCSTGYFSHGELEMRRRKVLRRYLQTWMIPDLVLLLCDILCVIFSFQELANEGVVSPGIVRAVQITRCARLLRLARLSRAVDVFDSMGLEVVKPLLSIIVINHLMGCAWYALGSPNVYTDTGLHWLNDHIGQSSELTYAETPWVYQYFTCLHWSMSQMTPGSMQVFPVNAIERAFNFMCLTLGMLVFGVLISSLSARMMQIAATQKERNAKVQMLRAFLIDKGVPNYLQVSALQQVQERMTKMTLPVVVADVAAVKLLSSSLQRTLQMELCKPYLMHPLLRWWADFDHGSASNLCNEAMEFSALMQDDIAFAASSDAVGAYVIVKGTMGYGLQQSWSSGTISEEVTSGGGLICEVALWCKWKHAGQLTATTACEILSLRTEAMKRSMEAHRAIQHVVVTYGRAFFLRVRRSIAEEGAEPPSDLPSAEMGFQAILPSLPLSCRLLLAAAAIKKSKSSSWVIVSTESWTSLLDEVRLGRSCLMFNNQGQVERIVSIVVLHLVRTDGCILAELGQVGPDGVVTVSCRLPGGKPLENEQYHETVDRLMAQNLMPLRDHITWCSADLQETVGMSERFQVNSRYLTLIQYAEWRHDYDFDANMITVLTDEPRRWHCKKGLPTYTFLPSTRRQSVSNARRPSASSGPLQNLWHMESDTGKESLTSLKAFALADRNEDGLRVYAWLTSDELDDLRENQAALESMFANPLPADIMEKAHRRRASEFHDLSTI